MASYQIIEAPIGALTLWTLSWAAAK